MKPFKQQTLFSISVPYWYWLVGTLALLVTVISYAIGWPLWVKVANVGTHSFAIGWVTKEKTSGCALVIKGKVFPTSIRSVCAQATGKTHLITIDELKENQTYRVMVRRGWRLYPTSIRTITTYTSKPNPSMPVPAYGTVMDLLGQRVPNALVYVYPTGATNVFPEAVLANEEGNYAVDLSFNGTFPEWIIEGGSGVEQWDVMRVSGETMTPFPPLEVSAYE